MALDSILTTSARQLGIMKPRPLATLHVGGNAVIDNGFTVSGGSVSLPPGSASANVGTLGGVLAGTLPNPSHAAGNHLFSGRLETTYAAPRISSTSWQTAHVRLNQDTPSEVQIGFHESGNSAMTLYKQSGSENLRIRGNGGQDVSVWSGAYGQLPRKVGHYIGAPTWSTTATGAWIATAVQLSGTVDSPSAADCMIDVSLNINHSGVVGANFYVGVGIDGAVSHYSLFSSAFASCWMVASFQTLFAVTPGVHTFNSFVHSNTAGTVSLSNGSHSFLRVIELRNG